ncbi:hypothetical protein GCM10022222_73500 [Amycolatopsis ultiminotia]|uniref:Uncharacterized protein n=1 Tax=Amycolatopsis ultiminotia TaxID=543629 RepID=A0ABP6Y769_9PSEU
MGSDRFTSSGGVASTSPKPSARRGSGWAPTCQVTGGGAGLVRVAGTAGLDGTAGARSGLGGAAAGAGAPHATGRRPARAAAAAAAVRRMAPAKQTRAVNADSTRSSDTVSGLLRLG